MTQLAGEGQTDANDVRVAAIDIGTNAIRLIVAEVGGSEGYRVLADLREQTRLGLRLNETGRIAPESGTATLDALERMKTMADEFGVFELRAIATAAVREAENGREFIETAREGIDLDIEVISSEQEAELALRSARARFPLGAHPAAIVDIGGGSMEVVFTTAGSIDRIHSLPVGAVRVTERFVHSDPIDETDWLSLRDGIDSELRALGKPPFPTPTLIGSGGTFTTIAEMAISDELGESGSVQGAALSRGDLDQQIRRLKEAPLPIRREMMGRNADRADIILAGAVVVARLARLLDVSRIWVNERGIRDGLILEMISQL